MAANRQDFRMPITRRALFGASAAVMVSRAMPASIGQEPKQPPFRLGTHIIDPRDPKTADLPPPQIDILKPAANFRATQGGTIDCLVRLTLPEGRGLPSHVIVAMRRDNVIYGSDGAKPKEQVAEQVYLFEARLKDTTKKMIGRFRIEVEVIDVYRKKFRPYSYPVPDKTVRTHFSIPIEFVPEQLADRGGSHEPRR